MAHGWVKEPTKGNDRTQRLRSLHRRRLRPKAIRPITAKKRGQTAVKLPLYHATK